MFDNIFTPTITIDNNDGVMIIRLIMIILIIIGGESASSPSTSNSQKQPRKSKPKAGTHFFKATNNWAVPFVEGADLHTVRYTVYRYILAVASRITHYHFAHDVLSMFYNNDLQLIDGQMS